MTNQLIEYAKKRINEFVWEKNTSEKFQGMEIKLSWSSDKTAQAIMFSFQPPMTAKKGTIATPIAINISFSEFQSCFEEAYKFYIDQAEQFKSSYDVADAQISNSKPHCLKQKLKLDPMYQSMKILSPIENERIAV